MPHVHRTLSLFAVVMLCQGSACQVVLGIDGTNPRLGDGGADAADASCADGDDCPWWNESFTRRRKLHIPGGAVTADVSNLPVLVTLNQSRITYAEAPARGASLRFIAADHSTELAYDIEEWQVDGTSHVWVLVPVVPAGGVDLWMYYGDAEAAAGARPDELWQGAGYESVHHLNENYQDASGQGHDGTATGQPDSRDGKIAGCYEFNGSDEYVELAGESGFDFQTSLSIEAWINVDQFDIQYQPVVAKGDDSWRVQRSGFDTLLQASVTESVTLNNTNILMQTAVPTREWHHVAAVYDGENIAVYFDGALDAIGSYSAVLNDSNEPVRIGHNSQRIDRYFDGSIDELRIAPVPRTAEWIAAAYATVADPSFIVYAADDDTY